MRKLLTIIIAVMSVCVLTGCIKSQDNRDEVTISREESHTKSIFDLPEEFFIPFLHFPQGNNYEILDSEYQSNGIDFASYYVQAVKVINIAKDYRDGVADEKELSVAEEIMENMIGTFHRNKKFPWERYETGGQIFETGWVSSMDAPTILIGSMMLYELTADEKYANFTYELLDYIVLNTSEGGYNYELNEDEIWPLEYAQVSSSDENNLYVLNGSLVGYLATKGANVILQSEELDNYLVKVERAYNNMFDKFHYADNNWTFYMLQPKTEIPIHYLIFEKKLFEGMYSLQREPLFEKEIMFRENLLAQAIECEFVSCDNKISYYLLRSCSPHEYMIDTYSSKIELINGNGEVIYEDINRNSYAQSKNTNLEDFYNGMFINGSVNASLDLDRYVVYSDSGRGWYKLFERPILIQTKPTSDKLQQIDCKVSVAGDAEFDKHTIKLLSGRSEATEGDLDIVLPEIQKKGEYYYCIELNNLSDYEIYIGLIIRDDKGNGASRYYTTLLPGKNLIVFDTNGFVPVEILENVSTIRVRFYEKDYREALIELGGIYSFNSLVDYYRYINETDYKIHPQ